MITIQASIKPKEEYYEECKKALLDLRVPTLKERGCLQFDLFESDDPDGKIYFFERFEDEESLSYHFLQEYTKDVFSSYEEWLCEEIKITKLVKINT